MIKLHRKIFRIYPKLKNYFYKQYNKFYLWINGVVYGKNMQVYNKVYVRGEGQVFIGDDFLFTSGDCINPICKNIRGSLITVTSESRIIIGDRVGISSACLWSKELIKIGNDVNIGGDCLIIDNDAHSHNYMERRRLNIVSVSEENSLKSIPSAPILIENDVWIGARCQILKGVHIGARSIIAAGSIVTKNIPADVVAGGNPCKIIRKIDNNHK